jgi:hypothetical protein
MNKNDKKETIQDAVDAVEKNEHQDLSQENFGNEPEEQADTNTDSEHKLEGYEDKRPESSNIKKGWTVDSNTSRSPEDLD